MRVKSQESRVESWSTSRQAGGARRARRDGTDLAVGAHVRSPHGGRRSHFAFFPVLDPRPSTLNPYRGVTLIELLITITIISILAAAVLGVAAVAGETAREAKSRTIISRIHTLLMEHYDTYASRRVKLRPNIITTINNVSTTTAQKGRLKAEARLYALRELMLMEVPDRWSDVILAALPSSDSATMLSFDVSTVPTPLYLDVANTRNGRTELASLYLRTFDRITKSANKITGQTNQVGEIRANQGAECLYMVIMNACGDGEARTLFPESNIGDTDGDGAPEFIDGWGHPIEFLRWAPGFASEIQLNANELDNPSSPTTSAEAWTNAGAVDHDPFDLYRAQPVAFRLVPLVVSSGRDEEFGLVFDYGMIPWRTTTGNAINLSTNFGSPPPYVTPTLNPYVSPIIANNYLGSSNDRSVATDNIHNHLIRTKP